METKIVNIINEMAEYLDAAQLRMLQEVLLNNLSENVPEKRIFLMKNIWKCILKQNRLKVVLKEHWSIIEIQSSI